jgi:hypothetical protein
VAGEDVIGLRQELQVNKLEKKRRKFPYEFKGRIEKYFQYRKFNKSK